MIGNNPLTLSLSKGIKSPITTHSTPGFLPHSATGQALRRNDGGGGVAGPVVTPASSVVTWDIAQPMHESNRGRRSPLGNPARGAHILEEEPDAEQRASFDRAVPLRRLSCQV